jgi:Tol biopolymer transport system component/C-terminal processing protease CtpA/Prc
MPRSVSRAVLLFALVLAARTPAASAAPEAEARWLRYPAISPDGSRIVFSHRGDLWIVPSAGGRAVPLTTHAAHETSPAWSPDGRTVAFASDRHGNHDVFVVAADGGSERRLTFHSAKEIPSGFTADGKAVLFSARRQDAPEAAIGSPFPTELWQVPVDGGAPTQVLSTPAEAARMSADGKRIAYEDLKSLENEWRKHHTSSAARDLWMYEPAKGTHVRLTANPGEDRNPVWAKDGATLWFLSERGGGTFNVWTMLTTGDAGAKPVTNHAGEPVRFLSAADDGTLCYAFEGSLWVKPPGAPAKRLSVVAPAGDRVNTRRRAVLTEDAKDMAVNAKGDTVAFVVRGEVFVASVKHGTTRRVTDTPTQERSVAWSPDGKTLYYAGERDGSWNLYAATLGRPEEERFFRATVFQERALLATADEEDQPMPSPDGKHVAYMKDRDVLAVLELSSGATKTLTPPQVIYSYEDGDIEAAWSPDSRWLAFDGHDEGRWTGGLFIVELATGKLLNVTKSGYQEYFPRWSGDGRLLTFQSDRYGQRSHASWGSEDDVLAVYLNRAARERANLSEEEYELLKEKEEKESEEEVEEVEQKHPEPAKPGKPAPKEPAPKEPPPGKPGKDGDASPAGGAGGGKDKSKDKEKEKGKKDEEEEKPIPPIELEEERIDERVTRLSPHSLKMGPHAITEDGETLLFTGKAGDTWYLWAHRPRKEWTRRLTTLGKEQPGKIELSKDGETLFVLDDDGKIGKIDVSGATGDDPSADTAELEPIEFAAEMTLRTAEERAYIFEHASRQAERKFYDPKLHGVDWPKVVATYRAYLPYVSDNEDFAELLSEMLGELNASHTGAGYAIAAEATHDKTAALGLLYDVRFTGAGAKVVEVIADGPADHPGTKLAAGALLTHVDGTAISAESPLEALLNRRAGQRVRLRFVPPAGGEPVEDVLKAITIPAERLLLYERWIRRCVARVDRISNGRVGYVHVKDMDDESFRRVYREALGRFGTREALVVDTRYNGGGWIHEDLVTFLSGKDWIWFVPRGKKKGDLGADPHARWTRPVAVVQNEANYSDAHMFPFAFRALGLGKLVGMPVAGTGTAVWWEEQIDPTLTFGIPQVGMLDATGHYLENQDLEPDVRVENDPTSVARGEDPQLEAATKLLLEELSKKPR